MTRTILIDTSTITGRVYRSGLFMRLCEQTSMSVGLKNNGVSFEGDEAEMMLGDRIVSDFKKENVTTTPRSLSQNVR